MTSKVWKCVVVTGAGLGSWIGIACDSAPTEPNGASPNGPNSAAQTVPEPDDPADGYDHRLRFARHVEQSVDLGVLDDLLAEAGDLLATVDEECSDVACAASFTRDGAVTTFAVADNIVTTEDQLDAVFDVEGDFKIVTLMVGVCGAPASPHATVVLGCAYARGSVVIAHDAPADVWAHEWGHVQGLPHRNDCAANIMHAYELETNAVNARERNAFLSGTPRWAFFRAAPAVEAAEPVGPGRDPGESLAEWVERLIARRYLAGIPAAAFEGEHGPQLTDLLIERLAEASDPIVRGNICRALGLAGDAAALPALQAMVAEQVGPLTTAEIAALTEGLMALGRLADLDASEASVGFLIAGANPETWSAIGLSTTDGRPLDDVLARICVLSLGLSNHPAALAHLREMQARLALSKPADPWLPSQVDEALGRWSAGGGQLRQRVRDNRMP